MPGIICKCGTVIRTGEIPNPHQLLVISDNDFDKFSGLVEAEDLYKSMKHVLLCPTCERLWFYWDGYSSEPYSYSKE